MHRAVIGPRELRLSRHSLERIRVTQLDPQELDRQRKGAVLAPGILLRQARRHLLDLNHTLMPAFGKLTSEQCDRIKADVKDPVSRPLKTYLFSVQWRLCRDRWLSCKRCAREEERGSIRSVRRQLCGLLRSGRLLAKQGTADK